MSLNEMAAIEVSAKTDRVSAWHAWTCWLWAMVGAVIIGVTGPVALVCWSCSQGGFPDVFPGQSSDKITELSLVNVTGIVTLLSVALVACGPGALILGMIVIWRCRKRAQDSQSSFPQVAIFGMWLSALLAFLNVPGYFASMVIKNKTYVGLRVALLFAVAGASSGAWIAWQAWRTEHAEERFFPRFSLGTLMLIVIGWGALMAVFAPK